MISVTNLSSSYQLAAIKERRDTGGTFVLYLSRQICLVARGDDGCGGKTVTRKHVVTCVDEMG